MDLTQLVITLGSVVGIVLVGALAVVPSLPEARAGRPDARPDARPAAPVAPTPLTLRRRGGTRSADLVA